MSTVSKLAKHLEGLGYGSEAVLRDYTFADVLSPSGQTRKVSLAAFTQTPPSYRTAAFGVVETQRDDIEARLTECKSLGAPAIFVVRGDEVELWQVRAEGPPRRISTTSTNDLHTLFAAHEEHWNPRAVHRAKAIEPAPLDRQLDLVDVGLLVAIEGEVHAKLDVLLRDTLAPARDARGRPSMDARVLFQATFRFLAAKILSDREHSAAVGWRDGNVGSVLDGIGRYYGLAPINIPKARDRKLLEDVWHRLRAGINFRNISADDLAFVYENTFVTAEVRERLGTHSTPRQMAEYVVRRLELWRDPEQTYVYEPFTGAGVLLVAALRQLSAALPLSWDDEKRHAFLTERLAGDEIDAFACEVAKLSLILADYPNHNGWDIQQEDLFDGEVLSSRITSKTFVLCNPPFEDFDTNERAPNRSLSKPIAVLEAVLKAKPAGIGFILPAAFPIEKRWAGVRERLEADFTSIEIVEIPDDIFNASRSAASLLIARDRRSADDRQIHLVSSEVTLRDRLPFLKAGVITRTRETQRWVPDVPSGDLWIPALDELWRHLADNSKLHDFVSLHRGLEWRTDQTSAVSTRQQRGFKRGLHSCRGRVQYLEQKLVWIDCREESARGGAIHLPWDQPKIILNAARLSRYQWRLAATFDTSGLVASQQFVGLWPKAKLTRARVLELVAALNGPVASAFAATATSPGARFRLATLSDIPLPAAFKPTVAPLVEAYVRRVSANARVAHEELSQLLASIDAEVLDSYSLPTRLERDLLEYFEGAKRPVAHEWHGWADLDASPGLKLSEIRRGITKQLSGNWVREVFAPLPEEEAAGLSEFVD